MFLSIQLSVYFCNICTLQQIITRITKHEKREEIGYNISLCKVLFIDGHRCQYIKLSGLYCREFDYTIYEN